MQTYTLHPEASASEADLQRGVFIVLLHASRIPPHIGLMGDGMYHSLHVKGQELNIPLKVLMKGITQRKIQSVFIAIKPHAVFSDTYLSEHFSTNVQTFERVDSGKATCLSPLRLFFEENWNLDTSRIEFLYELLPLLESKNILGNSYGFHLDPGSFSLPYYTMKEINEGIEHYKSEYKSYAITQRG
ncbi:MAG TPA: hypothetical protein VNZ86_04005 [Bacteroidia bacterium]|jgi:hypothetical protein|nr:hypothetical protein [Bacteroidia bacterium]